MSPSNHFSSNQHAIYGQKSSITSQDKYHTIYKMENETGQGIVTSYPVFSGIELLYNDMHMSSSTSENKLPRNNIMEINHCREGRFECEFSTGETAYLGSGDLAVNMLSNSAKEAWFPLSHYHGISILVDLDVASKTLSQVSIALGGLSLDILSIHNSLCANNSCFIMRSTDSIEHIFSELYTAPATLKSAYFKLKVMELFLFLSSPDVLGHKEVRPYFYKDQVNIIKQIRMYLINNLDKHITLNELASKFSIPLTSMKLCFKGVYGSPVNTYMQNYRMDTAAQLLRDTDNSVTDIAGQVGYKNTSKFSEVFKSYTKKTPTQYRRAFCLKGASGV